VDTRSPDVYRTLRAAGYLPQTPVLYDHLTGRELLRFVAALYGVGGEAFRQVEGLTDEMEMGASIDHPIRSYSLGMKRRIGLLAAIVHSPEYLFLDEPTASLDDAAIFALEGMIRRCRDRGGLILIATHRMESLGAMFDRVAVLKKGRLAFEGSPEAFRDSAGTRLKRENVVERGVGV
jgi:ABC-type multidrug transport system ATPase subunit